jgi:nicotinamidase/pyrazinamidase
VPEHPITEYDERTALIVVDMQNDFVDPDGSLHVLGGPEIVEPINAEIESAREAGALVVYSQDWHPESTPHFQKDGGVWPTHCVKNTWGAEFHPELNVVDAPIVKKGSEGGDGYSAFSVRDPESGHEESTELGHILRDAEVERIVVVGLAQDYCVKETMKDGIDEGYACEFLADLTRAVNLEPGDGARAVAEVVEAGATVR